MDYGRVAGGILSSFFGISLTGIGYDWDERYVEFGKNQGLNLRDGRLETIKEIVFDTVILHHVLEHTCFPLQILTALHDKLSEEGFTYVVLPDVSTFYPAYTNFQDFLHIGHARHFVLSNLCALVQKASFEFIAGNKGISSLIRKSPESIDSFVECKDLQKIFPNLSSTGIKVAFSDSECAIASKGFWG